MDTAAIVGLALPGLLLAAAVYGGKLLLSLANRVTKLEALREPMAQKLDVLCEDVRTMDRKLSEIIGRLQASSDD